MYEALIRPVVLYGHETWTLLEGDLKALEVFERRVLRTIFGSVRVNGIWRKRMNHKLMQLYSRPSIRKVTKMGRIRWAGHDARMPDRLDVRRPNQSINPVKLVFNSEPSGTRWLNQVEDDLESVRAPRDWRTAAQNRFNWQRIWKQVMTRRS